VDINITVQALHIHHHGATTSELRAIIERLDTIMASQAELAAELATVTAEVEKIGNETRALLQKIDDLTAALATSGATTPEVDAALAALKAQVLIVDQLVPDAP